MSTSVTMPQLGESVTEGTVTRWLKNVGDRVEMDEPLLEVSTDKVDTEIPSPVAGVLLEIFAVEDETIEVGGQLAAIGEASEASAPATETPAPAAPAATAPAAAAPATAAPAATAAAAPAAAAPASAASTTESAPAPAAEPDAPAATAAPQEPAPPATPAAGGEGTAVTLPALGESVTEGTVTRWLKSVGDQVAIDEPLLEVSTDKVDTEIPSPVAGVLSQILVNEDETVDVGTTLGIIGGSAGAAAPAPATPAAAPAAEQAPAPASTPAPATGPTPPAASNESGAAPYASPIVRKLARESGVDLSTVTPSSADGRISKADVQAAEGGAAAAPAAAPAAAQPAAQTGASPTPPTPAPAKPAAPTAPARPHIAPHTDARDRVEPMSRLRRVIAERMVESLQVSAQLTCVVEVDVTRIAALRNRAKDSFANREGVSLSFLPFFARATLEALRAFPRLNASINSQDNTITFHDAAHLGIAVDTDRGLLVPVIRDAGDLTLTGLARRISDLAERTRTNRVSPDELSGGTFTLTNTGSRGSLLDTPIINQPQVGILGTGAVVKRPVVIEGPSGEDVIAIRSMAYFALTYDHRLVDGADAARFLSAIKARLEAADFESELGL